MIKRRWISKKAFITGVKVDISKKILTRQTLI